MKALRDTLILFRRGMKHILRSPDTIITVAVMPAAMMLMLVYVFGGAVKTSMGPGVNYVNYQLPGILLMTAASGTAYTALRLFADIQKGLFSRFRSMPIARSALLWANVLTTLVSTAASITVIIAIGLAAGFRPGAGAPAWLAAAGMLLLFVHALAWVAVIPGLTAKSAEGSYVFSYPLIFLPFLSSAFVPTETMPAVLRAFAENQPVTSIVETLRVLLDGNGALVGGGIWIALAWCAGITIAAYFFAIRAHRRIG
jgi:ABC-2 type transport system permease protein